MGIPCLQSHVGSVMKALQPWLDVLSRNAKRPFSETNSVVSSVQSSVNKTCCFIFTVYWYRTDLTLVGSSPSAGSMYGPHRLLLHAGPFGFRAGVFCMGLPNRSLDHLHSFLVSCPAYFSHTEGKNSLVNGLFHFCSKLRNNL